jgi:hypothetical protein
VPLTCVLVTRSISVKPRNVRVKLSAVWPASRCHGWCPPGAASRVQASASAVVRNGQSRSWLVTAGALVGVPVEPAASVEPVAVVAPDEIATEGRVGALARAVPVEAAAAVESAGPPWGVPGGRAAVLSPPDVAA